MSDAKLSDEQRSKLFARGALQFDATEEILVELARQRKTKTELAKMMGKHLQQISRVLNGNRNITMNTLSDMAHALGKRVRITLEDK